MQQETGDPRNRSSPILPLVVAAFVGATLAVACERQDSRAAAPMPAQQGAAVRPGAPAIALSETPAAQASATSVSPPDSIADTMITARIKAAMLADPSMAGSDISVNTDHGVVTLTGNVKSGEQTGIASAHAQRQDGVMRVDSQLSMNPR